MLCVVIIMPMHPEGDPFSSCGKVAVSMIICSAFPSHRVDVGDAGQTFLHYGKMAEGGVGRQPQFPLSEMETTTPWGRVSSSV